MERNLKDTLASLTQRGLCRVPDPVSWRMPNAQRCLASAMCVVLPGAIWLPEYGEIADWLSCNHGRGLLCMGRVGRGKTLLCARVLPLIIDHYFGRVVNVVDARRLAGEYARVSKLHLLCVDDVGTEEAVSVYGNRWQPFASLADAAEKDGKLLLVTTNLSPEELREKYGERTFDRLKAITRMVVFNGDSLRG